MVVVLVVVEGQGGLQARVACGGQGCWVLVSLKKGWLSSLLAGIVQEMSSDNLGSFLPGVVLHGY